MEGWIVMALLAAPGVALFWMFILLRLWRGQIYRADVLVRAELNQMHRHTLWTAVMCAAMLVVTAFVPVARLYVIAPSLIMLFGILPLRTVFVEMGLRYNRNGKPKEATPRQSD